MLMIQNTGKSSYAFECEILDWYLDHGLNSEDMLKNCLYHLMKFISPESTAHK